MAETILVEEKIKSGRDLLDAIDHEQINIRAAYWLYALETDVWRLYFASPEVDMTGPIKMYRRIRRILVRTKILHISVDEIAVTGLTDPFIRSFKLFAKSDRDTRDIRLRNITIGSYHIDEAFIYRLY